MSAPPFAVIVPISIHALREEGDTQTRAAAALVTVISIHALREEGDHRTTRLFSFLHDFYPRPPRGGRHISSIQPDFLLRISIHALREEGDL